MPYIWAGTVCDELCFPIKIPRFIFIAPFVSCFPPIIHISFTSLPQAVAVERLCLIVIPFRARRLCTVMRARGTVLVLVIALQTTASEEH